jgi:hypothetical protein
MSNYDGYQSFLRYRVDADNVQDFLKRYYKPERITPTLYLPYQYELDNYGYCFISHHDSKTGEVVSFYGSI